MRKYVTKNDTAISIISEFDCFHQYLFEHDFFNNSYKSVFDLSIQNEQEKLNLYADCQSQLSTISEYFLYTNESFKKSHLYDLQKKYRSILELMILIKPDVKEYDLESLLSLEYQYKRIFDSASRNIAQQITNNNDNKEFNKKLQLLNQEYETKANFYTAAESKDKENSRDYIQEYWFKAGLKFVDGSVFNCKKIQDQGFTGTKFAELVFKIEQDLYNEEKFVKLIDNTRGYIGYTLMYINGTLNKTNSKNLFKEGLEDQWRLICNYHKEQGGKIDKSFEENFVKTYGVQIE